MIRYIMGRAGTGKSRRAIEEIGADLEQGGAHRLILLVPEQFTLQAERDLINQLQLPGIIRVEVLSFNRLAFRVLAEVGGRTRVLINDQGKNMVLKKVINEIARNLTIYQKAMKQEGFVEHLGNLLSEFKQYDLDPPALKARQEELEEGAARQKLQDIILIYEAFNNYMAGQYLDLEDQLNLFIDKLDRSSLIKDARIWLDGFTSFTPQHRRMLEKIMCQARDTTFCLTMDPLTGRDAEVFKLSRRCCQQIHEIAISNGLKEETIPLDSRNRPSDPLWHLERELYAYPSRSYPDRVKNIEIYGAANIYSEVEHIAASIVALVREQDYRWRDIAVLGNLGTYGTVLRRVFNEYEIPYFMDEKREISDNPIIKLILSSLAVINRGYRHDDIFLLLKTGFTDLNPEECEELENYMLAYGIQGRIFREEFKRGQMDVGLPSLERLNAYRQRLTVPLQKLEKNVQGRKSGREISRAIYRYLQTLEVESKLQAWTEELRTQGLYEHAHENAQIWNIVMQTFDQLVEILGGNEIGLKDYASILETGYKSFDVGIIPTTVDQVMVGDIQRSKNRAIKGLFVMGVNDGILPAGKSGAGIFTEEDKQFFKEHGLDWGSDLEMKSDDERYAIYQAFSKPSEFLGLSYAIADHEGKALRPSLLINRLHSLFPGLQRRSELTKSQEAEQDKVVTANSSFKYMVENLRLYLDGEAIDDLWWDVYQWYYQSPAWDDKRNAILEALFYENQSPNLSPQTAVDLYKLPFRSSVSRLEQFVACPFAHFVRFGLRPQERKTFAIGAPDIGVVLHDGLASFAASLAERDVKWRDLQRADCDAIMEELMDQKLPEHNNGILLSSYRYRYLAKRLKRISQRAVWVLTEHIQRGDFEPLLYEARFGPGGIFPALQVELSDGHSIYLEGRIDRIDMMPGDMANYVKIIDYKTGDRQVSLSDLYFGLSLQLFVYLLAVMNQPEDDLKPWKPAGLFYFKIDDPLIQTEEKVAADIEDKIRKALKMKGLVLKDLEIARAMDSGLPGNSDILPLGIKQNNEFMANSSVLGEPEFELLMYYLRDLLQELGNEMLRGKTLIEPAKTEQWKACTNCIYHSVCQFDKLFTDNSYRNIPRLQDEEVLMRIRNREAKGDE